LKGVEDITPFADLIRKITKIVALFFKDPATELHRSALKYVKAIVSKLPKDLL